MKVDRTVRKHLPEGRDYLIGYADLRDLLPVKYAQYGYGIVIARRLDDTTIDSIETGPNADYYALYREVNHELAEIADNIAAELSGDGMKALSIAPSLRDADRDEVFNQTLSLDFSHKMVATRAGLGWIGKSGLLITYQYGPRVRLVSILVDHPVRFCRKPVLKGECHHCDRCVQNCPAHALSGKEWDITTRREEFFDAFACREKCREFGEQNVGKGVRICGICVSVCSIGKRKQT